MQNTEYSALPVTNKAIEASRNQLYRLARESFNDFITVIETSNDNSDREFAECLLNNAKHFAIMAAELQYIKG